MRQNCMMCCGSRVPAIMGQNNGIVIAFTKTYRPASNHLDRDREKLNPERVHAGSSDRDCAHEEMQQVRVAGDGVLPTLTIQW